MKSIITVPAFGDNLIYLHRYNRSDCLAVDPGESSSVLRILEEEALSLKVILVTHHHWDHIGGNVELKQRTGCKIIGGDKRRTPEIDEIVEGGQIVSVGETKVQVIATPGHTSTSVCYYVPPSGDNKSGILWTGDTLFVGGCGRMFEGDAQSMWESLQRLAALPDDTLVHCGHDYTVENYEFALSVEPDNQVVRQRLEEIRQTGRTVPSTVLQERTTNVFLRAGEPQLKAALNMAQAKDFEVFAELRRRKDVF